MDQVLPPGREHAQFRHHYYRKGSPVALMIDLGIRQSTGNEKSLDDLMRYLWSRYSQRDVGFSPDEFADALDLVVKGDYEAFLDRYVRSTAELPLEEVLAQAGLALVSRRKKEPVTTLLQRPYAPRHTNFILRSLSLPLAKVTPDNNRNNDQYDNLKPLLTAESRK